MILNIKSIPNKFKCGKRLGRYLVYHGMPILGIDKNIYYFARTNELNKILKNLPISLKIFKILEW
jgi:hypothetical protein